MEPEIMTTRTGEKRPVFQPDTEHITQQPDLTITWRWDSRLPEWEGTRIVIHKIGCDYAVGALDHDRELFYLDHLTAAEAEAAVQRGISAINDGRLNGWL